MKKRIATISIITLISGFSLVPSVFADSQELLLKKIYPNGEVAADDMLVDTQDNHENAVKDHKKKLYLEKKAKERDHESFHQGRDHNRNGHSGRDRNSRGDRDHNSSRGGQHNRDHAGHNSGGHGNGHNGGHNGRHR